MVKPVGISKDGLGYISLEELSMRKLFERWASHLLNADQKQTIKQISRQCLELSKNNLIDFMRDLLLET